MRYINLFKTKLFSQWVMWFVIMLITIWSIYIQDGKINRDGLLYLKQAYLFAHDSWKEGLDLYPWPFFSILIAIFHKITNLHFHLLSHFLDLALFALATLFYLKTLSLIYKEKQTIFYGGLILLSFIPIMDDYVGMVLRDHGLWAGCMMGTYFYLKNLKEYSLRHSIFWQISFFLAFLFRPEAIIFLFLLPLFNIFHKKGNKLKLFLIDNILNFLIIFLSIIIILNHQFFFEAILKFRLIELVNIPANIVNEILIPLPISSTNFYLQSLLNDYEIIISLSVLSSILIYKWIIGLGFIQAFLLFYTYKNRDKLNIQYINVISMFLVVSFLLVMYNLFSVYVLSNRYWALHWWFIMILNTRALIYIFEESYFNKYLKIALSALIFILFCNVLIDKNENIEKDIAEFILNENLSNINYGDNDRINYYVNKDLGSLIQKNNQKIYDFELKKINPYYENAELINAYKVFGTNNPKYYIIKYDR